MSHEAWDNHHRVFSTAGLNIRGYRHLNHKTKELDIEGMLEDLSHAIPRSIVLFQTCGHNSSAVDPTMEQWKMIAEVCHQK